MAVGPRWQRRNRGPRNSDAITISVPEIGPAGGPTRLDVAERAPSGGQQLGCTADVRVPADRGTGLAASTGLTPAASVSVHSIAGHVFMVPPTTPLHMDPFHSTSSSSFRPQSFDTDESQDSHAAAQMKAPKRKRLAKACDACHKSKRRCDGTAPCSNCYYASKACSYTDASGRPVPAPRPFKPDRPENDQRIPQPSSSNVLTLTQDMDYSEDEGRNSQNNQHPQNSVPRKRFRNERGNAVSTEDISASLPLPLMDPPVPISIERPAPVELDHSLTRELTNLFFTHCHPARAIIHKPTFSASLAHNRVPAHLLHAVCAVAAPLSKQPRLRTSPTRFAGKPFAQEALSIMFDGAGRLVVERNLATAQALCLLQVHDVAAKDKDMFWNSRYHDLALQIVESLNVYQPDYPTLTPVPSPEFIHGSFEREAVRRIFWLIHLMDIMSSIYFKKPMVDLKDQGMRLRLPADETSFELGVHSTLPEYLYLPAVRTQYSSEFGHLIRAVTIYAKLEHALDEIGDPDATVNPTTALIEAEQMMDSWAGSLSDHLRFSEENLQVQQSMFETSSNTGAWCWCLMHVFHASSALALNLARQRSHGGPLAETPWALKTLDLIMNMLGDRAKNSILMGAALWSLVKYCKRDDAQIRAWCADYEDSWGTRMRELALQDCAMDWQNHYPPSPQQQQQQQHYQHQHRRVSEVRNPPTAASRPPSHQHDTSFTRRSPGSSSPTSQALRRPHEDIRQQQHTSNHNRTHTSHINSLHSDRDREGRGGHAGSSGMGQGLAGGNSHERDQENVGVGQQRSAGGSSGDGPQSLPSLKSSGLLDSWGPSGGGGLGSNGAQRPSPPRRSPPHSHSNAPEADNRALVSMPVGLQWLANESR
ncbi:hypothetical protein Hypma_009120 [Hypsizygus marmoreus]|uniref:Zn(2)-C6 fungal-type domain-containing protein n=1 Tax=Hypsizygus marmoreus TaxID=39966 RepID=A0A369JRZ0_HYPMA|nr:hypothetical protein Hypma_009120 [Hypsizygus marmoreus]